MLPFRCNTCPVPSRLSVLFSKWQAAKSAIANSARAELEDWLTSPLEQERYKEPFMARLFFAANLTYTEVVQLLAEREKQIERKL